MLFDRRRSVKKYVACVNYCIFNREWTLHFQFIAYIFHYEAFSFAGLLSYYSFFLWVVADVMEHEL